MRDGDGRDCQLTCLLHVYARWYALCLQSSARLLYIASRDGFAEQDYWSRCQLQGATLTLVKVNRLGALQ